MNGKLKARLMAGLMSAACIFTACGVMSQGGEIAAPYGLAMTVNAETVGSGQSGTPVPTDGVGGKGGNGGNGRVAGSGGSGGTSGTGGAGTNESWGIFQQFNETGNTGKTPASLGAGTKGTTLQYP